MRIDDKPEGIEDVVGIVLAPGNLKSLEYHLLCFVNVEFRAFDEIREIRFHERKRVKDIHIAADVGHGPEIRGLDFAQIQPGIRNWDVHRNRGRQLILHRRPESTDGGSQAHISCTVADAGGATAFNSLMPRARRKEFAWPIQELPSAAAS